MILSLLRKLIALGQLTEVGSRPPFFGSEAPLVVFVSSRIEEHKEERDAAIRAITEHFGLLARPWVFEFTPASSEPLDEAYLQKARTCDVFVLILGADISSAVQNEITAARTATRPILAFVKQVETRSADVIEVINRLDSKYVNYTTTLEFTNALVLSIRDELVRAFRKYHFTEIQIAILASLGKTKDKEGNISPPMVPLEYYMAEDGKAHPIVDQNYYVGEDGKLHAIVDQRYLWRSEPAPFKSQWLRRLDMRSRRKRR